MARKLSSKAQRRLAALEEAHRKWDRVHSLLEKAASVPKGEDTLLSQLGRAANDVKQLLMNNGLGDPAQNAQQLVILARRGTPLRTRIRTMRELVAAVRTGMDRAEKALLTDVSGN